MKKEKKMRRIKIKIKETLTANEILELHRKTIRKGPGRGHRVYYRYNKDNPRKCNMFLLH